MNKKQSTVRGQKTPKTGAEQSIPGVNLKPDKTSNPVRTVLNLQGANHATPVYSGWLGTKKWVHLRAWRRRDGLFMLLWPVPHQSRSFSGRSGPKDASCSRRPLTDGVRGHSESYSQTGLT